MAWTKTNPINSGLLINAPAQIRENWDALELGTDAALLITNAKVSGTAGIVESKITFSGIGHGHAGGSDGKALNLTDYVKKDGTTPLIGNWDVGAFKVTANQIESDVATGTAPIIVASTTKVTNLNADLLDGSSASTTTGNAIIPIADASGYLPDNSVDTSALKTAIGEISVVAGNDGDSTLPGGEYGFYPQVKASLSGGTGRLSIKGVAGTMPTTYVTNISRYHDSYTVYAQQRYVTASGQDSWVFLLVDKITKEIVSAYSAPDHPAYGNGGDFDKLPHPFGSYDEATQEIIILDKETCLALKIESEVTGKSILTLVNEEYKPNMVKEETYQPLHSGKFLGKEPELVQTIPTYIKVRKLEKLIQTEKDQKEAKGQQLRQKAEQDKQKKAQNRISAENKLKALGLTEDEIEVI